MAANGVKFTPEALLATGRSSSTGQVIFLETGNARAGLTPRGPGAAVDALPDNYSMLSRWVNADEVPLWFKNGGTAIPDDIRRSCARVYASEFGAPRATGATGNSRSGSRRQYVGSAVL